MKNSPIICELDTIISNVMVGFPSKPSEIDFDVIRETPSKPKNCPVNEVEQTVKHFDKQVTIRKKNQSTPTEYINNPDNNTVKQNIWGTQKYQA